MVKANEDIYTLLDNCVRQVKVILEELDEFYPVCFYIEQDACNSMAIADWEGDAKSYYIELEKVLRKRLITKYCIALNIRKSSSDAIELNVVYDNVGFSKAYVYYKKNKTGNYIYSELIA